MPGPAEKPLGIVLCAIYFAASSMIGMASALLGFMAAPAVPWFAFMFAATFAFAVADVACANGLWTRQVWARQIAFGVVFASVLFGLFYHMFMPDAEWLIFIVTTGLAMAVLGLLDTEGARAYFGLPGPAETKKARKAQQIPAEFDFRLNLTERNAE